NKSSQYIHSLFRIYASQSVSYVSAPYLLRTKPIPITMEMVRSRYGGGTEIARKCYGDNAVQIP
ncbi:UNVERIFIED_CONTAM: hypothetical protein NY100_29040, partial [Prevotella sp. 15_C9]